MKTGKIEKIKSELIHYDKNNLLISASLAIRTRKYQKFIKGFMDNKKPTQLDLDAARLIISVCRDIWERDMIAIPLDDFVFDRVLETYKRFEDEPLGKQLNIESFDYPELAGTLHKCYSIYDDDKGDDERPSFEEHFNRWKNKLSKSHQKYLFPIMLSDKKDGISITLTLEAVDNNTMIVSKATTRGDKEKGMNVTKIFEGMKFNKHPAMSKVGIQTEFMINSKMKKKFEKIKDREYKTLRSASVGLLAALQYAKTEKLLREYQSCISLAMLNYDYAGSPGYSLEMHEEINMCIPDKHRLDLITETIEYEISSGEIFDRLQSFIDERLLARENLGYDIDGVVIRLLDPKAVKKLGRKNNINGFQVAYKFPEMKKATWVKDLIVERGAFNYISLLAEVEPVLLNGTTQYKGQIHSLKRWYDMDLRFGDPVMLQHSGDVIPYMTADPNRVKSTGPKLELPTHCDIEECGWKLVVQNSMLRCKNPACPGAILGKLVTFIERVGVKSVKESKIKAMMEIGIDNPFDMINITPGQLKAAGLGTKKTMDLILGEFERVKKGVKPEQLLSSLAIDKLGRRASKKILEDIYFDELISLSKEQLYQRVMKIPGHKHTLASLYSEGIFKSQDILKDLLGDMNIFKKDSAPVFDKKILVSGLRNDEEIISKAHELGYGVEESSWTDVKILVIKDDTYRSKGKGIKASKKKILIKTREEFLNMEGN